MQLEKIEVQRVPPWSYASCILYTIHLELYFHAFINQLNWIVEDWPYLDPWNLVVNPVRSLPVNLIACNAVYLLKPLYLIIILQSNLSFVATSFQVFKSFWPSRPSGWANLDWRWGPSQNSLASSPDIWILVGPSMVLNHLVKTGLDHHHLI